MIPLTYAESRARFLLAADRAGATMGSHTISARGPDGAALTIDVAVVGAGEPRRGLLVMSGTHGIEGFAGSAMQADALADGLPVGDDVAVVFVHAVNPWGMAAWRRYNEHNVDLNRNWHDFETAPPEPNDAYAEVHPVLCPEGGGLPDGDGLIAGMSGFIEERGLAWVRHAVSAGQYSHPDGLYYGGAAREESTIAVERMVVERLAGVEAVLSVDLHTGHGEYGTATVLSRAPMGSPGDAWIRTTFDGTFVETTVGNDEATLAAKTGQLGHGLVAELAEAGASHTAAVTLEIGTRSETHMIIIERTEHWVHRFGSAEDPAHRDAIWQHRIASIPDDEVWEQAARGHGRRVLRQAAAAISGV